MRILFIATQLPPFNGSGNIRALNYINYLNRLGHKVDVIGVDFPTNSIAYDESLNNVFDNKINIHRINPGYFYKFFYTKKSNSSNKKNKESQSKSKILINLKKKINTFIKQNILIPDAFLFWIKPAYKKACELLENEKYDCIFTMHETPSSHIVGLKIKKKYKNIKWIAYWSDPWNGDSVGRENSFIIKKLIEEKIEKNVINMVDKYLFTTEKTKEMYINKYSLKTESVDIVFRGYEGKQYDELKNSSIDIKFFDENKFNIVHVGTIYPELRDISYLCEALVELQEKDKEVFEKFNFVFVGFIIDDKDKERLSGISNIKVIDPVPYSQALNIIVQSDCLILYGNKNSTQVPGKVYEYAGSGASILTILGDSKDELKYIMKDLNKGPTILNTKEEIKRALYEVINPKDDWRKPAIKYEWFNVAKDIEHKIIN